METPNIIASQRNGKGYFELNWSHLVLADRHTIPTSVPAMAGIYELYRMDEEKKLNLLTVALAWYGGLRSQIRQAIEPTLRTDPEERKLIEDSELYCRYSISNNLKDIEDVLWFLHMSYFKDKVLVNHSGRFSQIYVKENAPDKVHWI